MTINQWAALPNNLKVGNFWVIDHQTGWAYWANQLQAGETTSYLLDAAQMTAAADNIPGEYYYGIHVDGQLISPDRINDFLAADPDYTHHADLSDFLTAVQNGSIDNNWGNPGPNDDVQPDQINFSLMAPGTIFTMAGEQYRYLENQGGGNHLIIRNRVIPGVTFEGQEARLDLWYSQLESSVQSIVRPVADNFITGNVVHEDIIFEGPGERWQASNLQNFLVVASDLSQSDSSGTSKAFALSLADVTHLSGPGRAFPNHDERGALSIGDTVSWWWLRTPGDTGLGWFVSGSMRGELFGTRQVGTTHSTAGGIRPALIINQPL